MVAGERRVRVAILFRPARILIEDIQEEFMEEFMCKHESSVLQPRAGQLEDYYFPLSTFYILHALYLTLIISNSVPETVQISSISILDLVYRVCSVPRCPPRPWLKQ